MRWGVCTEIAHAGLLKRAGWDFVEESVQRLLQANLPDDQWCGAAVSTGAELPVEVGSLLLPAKMKVAGPEVDAPALRQYMMRITERARQAGMKILVFGSGKARAVPDGFSPDTARQQILDFSKMAADLAEQNGITLVLEHLNRAECNILNTVADELAYVKAVNHPHFRCLVDSYHLWQERETLEAVANALPFIKHVHVADAGSRIAPGQGGPETETAYREFFGILKRGGYNHRISVEAQWQPPMPLAAKSVLTHLKTLWQQA